MPHLLSPRRSSRGSVLPLLGRGYCLSQPSSTGNSAVLLTSQHINMPPLPSFMTRAPPLPAPILGSRQDFSSFPALSDCRFSYSRFSLFPVSMGHFPHRWTSFGSWSRTNLRHLFTFAFLRSSFQGKFSQLLRHFRVLFFKIRGILQSGCLTLDNVLTPTVVPFSLLQPRSNSRSVESVPLNLFSIPCIPPPHLLFQRCEQIPYRGRGTMSLDARAVLIFWPKIFLHYVSDNYFAGGNDSSNSGSSPLVHFDPH